MKPVCEACGLPGHTAKRCNRPEGVKLRGGTLRMSRAQLDSISRESVLKGAKKGGKASGAALKAKAAARRGGRRSGPHDTLVREIYDYLRLRGIPVFRVNQKPHQRKDGTWHTPGADVGAPDLVAVIPPRGKLFWVEVKTGRAKPTPAQLTLMTRFGSAGACTIIARSVKDVALVLNGGTDGLDN